MINILIHGCNGKMGQVITELAGNDKDICVTAGVDTRNDIGNPYPVFKSLDDVKTDTFDVIIDFSKADAVGGLIDYCDKTKKPVVICTTGLTDEIIRSIGGLSNTCPVLRSANMSIGINMLLKLLKQAATGLAKEGFDIEIIEKHHNEKLDSPSGTAIALANSINEEMGGDYEYKYGRTREYKKRNANEIGISAVRGGTIVGEHDVIFAGTDEVVTISHTAYSKKIFAKGAIAAAKYICKKEPGMYNMSNVIEQ